MTHEQQCLWPIVARHFKVKKEYAQEKIKSFFEDTGECPVVEFDYRDMIPGQKSIRVATSKATCKLGELIVPKCFKKSRLYSEVSDFIKNSFVDFVAFKIGSTVMAVSLCDCYDGDGGVVVKVDSDTFAIEPVQNYLKRLHPMSMDLSD